MAGHLRRKTGRLVTFDDSANCGLVLLKRGFECMQFRELHGPCAGQPDVPKYEHAAKL